MKSFSTRDGDVIVGKTIEMVDGGELLRQKVERVVGTNQGEWFEDLKEGISFPTILRKNSNIDEVRATFDEALKRIDETFTITAFSLDMNGRDAVISFRATNDAGKEVGGEYFYG